MADLQPAVRKVLRHEGVRFDASGAPIPGHDGYVNNPDDPGRETRWGITEAKARSNGYQGPMRDLPYELALEIYRIDFWNPIRGDEIEDQEIAEEMFDTGVNCGVMVVKRFLQRTLNVLNKKGTLYPDLVVDGAVGPRTIAALHAALRVAPYYRLCILRALDSLQCVRYMELGEHDEKYETFMPGWLRIRVGVHSDEEAA